MNYEVAQTKKSQGNVKEEAKEVKSNLTARLEDFELQLEEFARGGMIQSVTKIHMIFSDNRLISDLQDSVDGFKKDKSNYELYIKGSRLTLNQEKYVEWLVNDEDEEEEKKFVKL